jgi:hypothetical protein
MLTEGPQIKEPHTEFMSVNEVDIKPDVTSKPTPIYEMDDIIRVMMAIHQHLIEYFNPEGAFHQFLLRRDGHSSIGFEFGHRMSVYIQHVKIAPTDIKTMRDLYIDALVLMPETQGFSMLQYLRQTNRDLYEFLKLNMHILEMLHNEYLYERVQMQEQIQLERQKYQIQMAQAAILAEQFEIFSMKPELNHSAAPGDCFFTLEDYSSEPEAESSCCLAQAFNVICHKFSSLKIGRKESSDQEYDYTPIEDSFDSGMIRSQQRPPKKF